MKKPLLSLAIGAAALAAATPSAAAVEYVKVCSLYGEGFHYIPGTDICLNDRTGDARQQTVGGTWRSLLPYPEGKWVTIPSLECVPGRQVNVGNFSSTDFTLNPWDRKQTQPVPLTVKPGEFITKVMMSGGFYDPRTPSRGGVNGTLGLCVRSIDPSLMENGPDGPFNPPFGNGLLPIGCVANSRIANMPGAYSISATAAYPSIDAFFIDAQQHVSGPYTYGSKLVVTTDIGTGGSTLLTYFDNNSQTSKPLAGKLSVSVCVEQGTLPSNSGGGH